MLSREFNDLGHGVRLRALVPDDLPFISELYASTRIDEINQVDWPVEQKTAFLEQQFQAQHTHYQKHFPEAEFLVIEQLETGSDDGDLWRPIGRLYLDLRDDEIRLIDIALLPAQRNAGLGTRILQRLLAVARQRKLDVRIHVEQFNRAAELYRRHGFRLIELRGIYLFMEWTSRGQKDSQANTAS
jgi:ribosomal protein S18 acetylase RimI-like enzyme